ncbi:transposase [Bacillota bacterium HCP3S3_E9]
MPRKQPHRSKQFKLDAVNYRKEHPDLTQAECARNLGIGLSTLSRWEQQFRDNDGDIPGSGSGNYATAEEREIARLKRELVNGRSPVLSKKSERIFLRSFFF